jgi:hypothetical protein
MSTRTARRWRPRTPRRAARGAPRRRSPPKFRRDTTGVDAGTPETFALDHGHFHSRLRETCRQSGSGLSRTDHDCVETRSHSLLLSSAHSSSPAVRLLLESLIRWGLSVPDKRQPGVFF